MRRIIICLIVSVFAFQLTGCGDSTPKQATDPAALEQERTKGREVRESLEGGPKKPPGK
jgi:hypothetical protein